MTRGADRFKGTGLLLSNGRRFDKQRDHPDYDDQGGRADSLLDLFVFLGYVLDTFVSACLRLGYSRNIYLDLRTKQS